MAAASEDTAAQLIAFINGDMSGRYTLDDVMRRFGSPATDASSSRDGQPLHISILRRLIDAGTVPPPQL